MKRWVLPLVLCALVFGALEYARRYGYTRGYQDGRSDGDNAGYLAGQRSVECPK